MEDESAKDDLETSWLKIQLADFDSRAREILERRDNAALKFALEPGCPYQNERQRKKSRKRSQYIK